MSAELRDALARFDQLERDGAERALAQCCGARRWAALVAARRPFADVESFKNAAQQAFELLTESDWLEAFAHHPRIGDIESLKKKFASTAAWAGGEQAGAAAAGEELLRALQAGNDAYFDKFGFIFIVCATGKSAAEMLALLQARLSHSRDEELRIAAGEQRKITALRIDKLLQAS